MTWSELRGHAVIVDQFRARVARGRLASTFLFVGPAGVGKRTFALQLAQALLCRGNPPERVEACGHCESCQQVAAGSHPDLEVIAKPADKSFIPIELLIGDREHRMQEGLCHRIGLKPFCGGRKIAIIDDADYLNVEGANCLLKTLEEPPANSVLILIGTSEQRQLPTIRSRCQVVRFGPLSRDDVVQLLLDGGRCANREEAIQWAELGEGSIDRALAWSESSLREFRERLLAGLVDRQGGTVELARDCLAFVDEAGKEAAIRRARLRVVLAMAADFFRNVMRAVSQCPIEGDSVLAEAVRNAAASWSAGPEVAAACLERCLDAQAHVDANAQPGVVVDAWVDDLTALPR